jgi:hypothetical protein
MRSGKPKAYLKSADNCANIFHEEVEMELVDRGRGEIKLLVKRFRTFILGVCDNSTAADQLRRLQRAQYRVLEQTAALRWHLEDLTGGTTLTDHEVDILVAHWADAGIDGVRAESWIWDDAVGCYFLLPFPAESITGDRVSLEKLFESLWVWYEPDPPPEPPDPANPDRPRTPSRIRVGDPRIKTLSFEIARTRSEGLIGGGGASVAVSGFSRPRPGRHSPFIYLYRRGAQAWLVIRLGKPWFETPLGMYEVAERFPPLRERVPEWSMNRLLYEYGRPLVVDWLVGTTERDAIILAELLRRDLHVDQLRQLLDRSRNQDSSAYEGYVVTGSIVRTGKSKHFESILREEIVRAIQNPSEGLGNMLADLEKAMEVDVSDLAVKCVGLRQYVSFKSLHYLESRAHTLLVYNALREMETPKEHLALKERALSAIQKRLASEAPGVTPRRP